LAKFSAADHRFMLAALAEAALAPAHGDIPVGAVVAGGGEILGRGHNRREADRDPTAHAEMIALRQAGAALGDWRLGEAVIYVTLEPCPMCAAAIAQSRLRQIVYGADDPRLGACGSLLNLAQFPGFPHDVAVRSGLLAAEAQALLRRFFADLRPGQPAQLSGQPGQPSQMGQPDQPGPLSAESAESAESIPDYVRQTIDSRPGRHYT
jgi:tRNA(adenine34) deaminase